jgi:hypothetical protein
VSSPYFSDYRPETIQDLRFAVAAVPTTMSDTFSKFHATGTQSSEISHFDKPEVVDKFFDNEQQSMKDIKKEMVEALKEAEKEREEEREGEP